MQIRRIMRLPEVMAVTGYKRSSIYNFMQEDTFPKCYRIGKRAVGWDSVEVERWVKTKLRRGA
ncbi:AlpA family phage regulatory protein [Parahaliea sp. F7430]|uniref:AlpA family phage regulatory protein n=2 Tax=Sediminihaliea albiluteola TaxID=2758564 RepID=A0A7W2TUU4_9GAMM|nr:AlpA family phage regulatory protein [Sediminihaliea albiluteola]